MTQEEFNAMLEVAIARGIGGGTYISRYSGEEIDTLLGLTSYAAGSTVIDKLTTDVEAAQKAAEQAASAATGASSAAAASAESAAASAQSIEGDVDAAQKAAQEAEAWAEHAGSISVPDGSITTAKLADEAVTMEKLSPSARRGQNLLINSNWSVRDAIVDQRQGYVVPPGTNYYVPGNNIPAGTTETYYTVTSVVTSSGVQYAYFQIDGTEYLCYANHPSLGFIVRGYTGPGYTIDGLNVHGTATLLVKDGHLTFVYGNQGSNIRMVVETSKFPHQDMVFSVLTAVGLTSIKIPADWTVGSQYSARIGETQFRCAVLCTAETIEFLLVQGGYYPGRDTDMDVIGVGLNPGSVQTYFHQEENGNWVPNEVQIDGDELARCRFTYRTYGPGLWAMAAGSSMIVLVPFDMPMRANPKPILLKQSLAFLSGGTAYNLTGAAISGSGVTKDGCAYCILSGSWGSQPTSGTVCRIDEVQPFLAFSAEL